MRSISRVVPVIIAGTVGVSWPGDRAPGRLSRLGATPAGTTTTTTSIASSARWAAEGAQLVRETHGNWAYESVPIDITGNGTYLCDFGPVPASFDYPSNPEDIAFDWPPAHFSMGPVGTPTRTVTLRGTRYFQVGFTVFRFLSPYGGYRAWIY